MARWRSRSVSLVLIGIGAAACSPEPTYRRNIYASQDDCRVDYSAQVCGPSVRATQGFYGPMFWAGGGRRPVGDPGPGASASTGASSRVAMRVTEPVRITQPARGGFGATGRGYRGGGGSGG